MWTLSDEFNVIVQQVWQSNVVGVPMYKVVKSLKILKGGLRKLNKNKFYDIENKASLALTRLVTIQQHIYFNSLDADLHNQEFEEKEEYTRLNKARLSFLKQNIKQEWIKGGNENSTYFHAFLKKRRIRNHDYRI